MQMKENLTISKEIKLIIYEKKSRKRVRSKSKNCSNPVVTTSAGNH